MSAKDNSTAKPAESAEIGEALVAALGFEPADGKEHGRTSGSSESETITMSESLEDLTSASTNGDEFASGFVGDTVGGAATESAGADSSLGPATTGEIPGLKADSDSSVPPPPGAADAIKPAGDKQEDEANTKSTSDVSSSGETSSAKSGANSNAKSKSSKSSKSSKKVKASPSAATKATAATASGVDVDKKTSLDAAVPTSPPVSSPAVAPSADAKLDTPATSPASPAAPTAETKLQPVAPPTSASGLSSSNPFEDFFSKNPFRQTRKVQARKVRRVIRHIDPWSVLTFSVLFHLCVFAALLLASVLVWNAAEAAGTIENMETFILELGDYDTFEIKGDVVFRAAVAIAGILTLASSVLVVLLTVIFNLISDLVGGIRLTVIEEETVRVKRSKRPS